MKSNDLPREESTRPNKRLYLSLPLPPSVNHMYVNVKGGRKLTGKSEKYIKISKALINDAIYDQRWNKENKAVWLYVDCVFYMPDRRIRDSHNMLKLLLDVMQDTIFENDYYAMPRIQSVEYDPLNPRVEVAISTQHKISREKGIDLYRKKSI